MKAEIARKAALRIFELLEVPYLDYIMVQGNENDNSILITAHYNVKGNDDGEEGAANASESEKVSDNA